MTRSINPTLHRASIDGTRAFGQGFVQEAAPLVAQSHRITNKAYLGGASFKDAFEGQPVEVKGVYSMMNVKNGGYSMES